MFTVGELIEFLEEDPRELLPEECGIAAAIGVPHAAAVAVSLDMILQGRGEAGAGMVCTDRVNFHHHHGEGSVSEVFANFDYDLTPGNFAIAHNRYPTKGCCNESNNLQPLVKLASKFGPIALAHNGTLVGSENLRKELVRQGKDFNSTTDSELLLALITGSKQNTVEDACIEAFKKVKLAYSLLVMTSYKTIAARDRYGVRPLFYTRLKRGGYLVASETAPFRMQPNRYGTKFMHRGSMVVFDHKKGTAEETIYAHSPEAFCQFECTYFGNPRTRLQKRNYRHEDFRRQCGEMVYQENKKFFDWMKKEGAIIVGVPESGLDYAWGLAQASGIELAQAFRRNINAPHAVGRSYTSPTAKQRWRKAFAKLDLREEHVSGRIVILVEDSQVRGTTGRINNWRLYHAGADQVVNVQGSPPVCAICPTGMDHQTPEELLVVKAGLTGLSLADYVDCDYNIFISLGGYQKLGRNYEIEMCNGCFGGRYPPGVKHKTKLPPAFSERTMSRERARKRANDYEPLQLPSEFQDLSTS